jgi:hypothetical protein
MPTKTRAPPDVIGTAILVAKFATLEDKDRRSTGKIRGGKAGARARAEKLTARQRPAIARKGATGRWSSELL